MSGDEKRGLRAAPALTAAMQDAVRAEVEAGAAEALATARTPLDLADPLVREMAEHNHRPAEYWRGAAGREPGVAPLELDAVLCRRCFETWPCRTRGALRALAAEEAGCSCSCTRCRTGAVAVP